MDGGALCLALLCGSTEAVKQPIIFSVLCMENVLCMIFSYQGRALVASLTFKF